MIAYQIVFVKKIFLKNMCTKAYNPFLFKWKKKLYTANGNKGTLYCFLL